jgi:hypothetical protein
MVAGEAEEVGPQWWPRLEGRLSGSDEGGEEDKDERSLRNWGAYLDSVSSNENNSLKAAGRNDTLAVAQASPLADACG